MIIYLRWQLLFQQFPHFSLPKFVRKILLFITGYAWLALVAGLGLGGMTLHSLWKAQGDHAWTAREQLTPIEGSVTKAARISIERKRRGRTSTHDSHYELHVQDDQGAMHTLRVDLDVSEEALAYVIEEPIVALADAENNWLVYEIHVRGEGEDEQVFAYEDMRNLLQKRAERAARNMNNAGVWGAALGLVLLGSGGIWCRRKLLAAATRKPDAADAAQPGGG